MTDCPPRLISMISGKGPNDQDVRFSCASACATSESRAQLLEGRLGLPAQFGLELRQIAPGGQHPAMLVDHLEVHEQVRRQRFTALKSPGAGRLHLVPHVGDQRIDQALLGVGLALVPAFVVKLAA